jgi:thiol:disulfide interchange protein DsbC
MLMTRLFAAIALAAVMLPAAADEAAVRRMMEEKLKGGAQLHSVQKTPWGNLYEVAVRTPDGLVLYYVDEEMKIVIDGQVIDAKTGRNFTEERQRELSKVSWESLPLQWAITSKRGTGRRKIAILSDPNCPYCKRFEADLAKLDDVTVHILPYPVISPMSVRQAKAVWCSKDRVKAWNDLMFRRIEPQASPDCDTPIEKIVEAGRRLGASATPTWFVETGERYSGAMPLDKLTRVLDKASPKR